MTTIIRDENGNEEIVEDSTNTLRGTIIFIVITIIWGYIFFNTFILPAVLLILVCLSLFLYENRIIFDERIKSIIVERRAVAHKKLKWKKAKEIKFSDTVMVTVEKYDNGWGAIIYNANLTYIGGISHTILTGNDAENVKKLAIRLCKITGAIGYYVDNKKKSTPLIEHGDK